MSFNRKEMQDYTDDASWLSRKVIWKIVGLIIMIEFVVFGIKMIFVPTGLIDKTVTPDNIISNYEEFQAIYNACQKLNTDMGMIKSLPDNDKMFESFSKNAILAAKMQQMSRWVEEYNAKSKMITRRYWKSTSLPHQLNVNEFNNYGGTVR